MEGMWREPVLTYVWWLGGGTTALAVVLGLVFVGTLVVERRRPVRARPPMKAVRAIPPRTTPGKPMMRPGLPAPAARRRADQPTERVPAQGRHARTPGRASVTVTGPADAHTRRQRHGTACPAPPVDHAQAR